MQIKLLLWKIYCSFIDVVSGVFRTNNVEGEFSEELMSDFYNGTLAIPSTKGYDFSVGNLTYQVKSRLEHKGEGIKGNLSDIRHWEFTHLIVVLYKYDGTIRLVKEIPNADAQKLVANKNRGIISVFKIANQNCGRDITSEVKAKYNL